MADDVTRRLDALLGVTLRLARSAPSGLIALAQVERALELSWVPLPWGESIVEELRTAADAAREPIPFRQIERALRDAWSAKPTDELDELDPEPVAVTPGAQVHRGVLDGDPVAVKVLRPGLASSVRHDLSLLEGLLAPLASAFPAIDAAALLREVRERVLDELDLEHEAGIQRRFHRALRRHSDVVVPAPVMRLAHPGVTVSEWINGVALRDAGERRDVACETLVRFSLGAQRSLGLAHADIDPDDVLVLADGRIAVLDFGAVAPVPPDRVAASAQGLEAFAAGDGDALGRVLEASGALPAHLGPVVLSLARHALGPLGDDDAVLDVETVSAARDRLLERPDDLLDLITHGALPPADLWPARGVAQTFSAVARVGATGPWLSLAREALRDGWG